MHYIQMLLSNLVLIPPRPSPGCRWCWTLMVHWTSTDIAKPALGPGAGRGGNGELASCLAPACAATSLSHRVRHKARYLRSTHLHDSSYLVIYTFPRLSPLFFDPYPTMFMHPKCQEMGVKPSARSRSTPGSDINSRSMAAHVPQGRILPSGRQLPAHLRLGLGAHEDVARVQVRVHEVVQQQHLQVRVHAQPHDLGASQPASRSVSQPVR